MTINEAYNTLKKDLNTIYDVKESANIAQLVMEKVSGLSRIDVILKKSESLNNEQLKSIIQYSKELLNHKPVQYVLNEAWFAGMKFYVDETVLIPRPETEELVEWIILDAGMNSVSTFHDSNLNILDIGTGSGCIAIALKKKIKNADVFALDTSEPALKTAQQNAKQNNVTVHFFKADILQIETNEHLPLFDVIVSNPPYIPQQESAGINANVIAYEPHPALFVPDRNPLLFYEHISEFALLHLKQNGSLYFEINESYGADVAGLLQQKGYATEIKKDMQQKNRMVKAVFCK